MPFAFRRLHARMAVLYAGVGCLALVLVAVLVIGEPVDPDQDGLFGALAAIGLVGLVLTAIGGWLLMRSVAQPIIALDGAVRQLLSGEPVPPVAEGDDEIGRLARSFNAMVASIHDREARLTHMALHDQETGLPNRLCLEREAAGQAHAWLLLVSVDRFDIVRNAIGYDAMAQLLAALGRRVTHAAGGAGVARVGANAIGLLIEAADAEAALNEAQLLRAAAEAPLRLAGATVDVALTVGLARCADGSDGVDSVVDRAAIAVDQARAARRPVALFDRAAYGDPAGNLSLISELMTALQAGEVTVCYQPKFDLKARAIVGAEALMRWTHHTRGPIAPDLFIGMAEETGYIQPLTRWVIDRAIADQKTLRERGHDMPISVNISGRLLSDEVFADQAIAAVATSGARLCFEITETAVIDNPEVALGVIERLSAAGVRVSIDDYGSGLSSLTYLKRIRADELKIDKAFVLSLEDGARDALLVKSTIDLAHSLGLKVTAEGVETPVALALLQGMGCDMAQGFLVGRPMPLAELITRLEEGDEAPSRAESAA